MRSEIESLEKLVTWNLLDLPKELNVIQTKWVLDLKLNLNGKVIRHKAFLVVKGHSQIPGIDFLKVFSQV